MSLSCFNFGKNSATNNNEERKNNEKENYSLGALKLEGNVVLT